ncbi:MAG: DEAD/DEAH box helicase family protein [Bacteroidota bacterium]
MIKLRPYQQSLHDQIVEAIVNGNKKILCQAETGFGKSILIGNLANQIKGRTLILTHRIELLNQNSEWINDLGVLTAKVRKVEPLKLKKNVIAMSQTMHARIKKYGASYVGNFDNVIADEVHMDFFKKVYDEINPKRVFGFTATPIKNKKEYKTIDGTEFQRNETFSNEFDILLQGVKTQELIELGYLTQDFNIQLTPPNMDKLVNSNTNPDGYTSESLTSVFGSHTSIENVMKGYLEYGVGKKTIIFNPTTAVNKKMHEEFIEKGIECRMFDSVNKGANKGMSRQDVVDWFIGTKDAVLLNVGVFTTGFSVNDLEVIIYNKATKSLSLYLQSIGRGSRTGDKILKDKFFVLDMGLNIKRHGKWSKNRDWQKHFKPQQWKKKKESDMLMTWECKECGYLNRPGECLNQELERIECCNCQTPRPVREAKTINGKLVVLDKPRPPRANTIIQYTIENGEDANFAFKLLDKKVYELFDLHDIESDFFNKNRARFADRLRQIYLPVYFSIIKNKDLKGKNRRLDTQLEKVWDKIESLYTKN